VTAKQVTALAARLFRKEKATVVYLEPAPADSAQATGTGPSEGGK